MFPNGRRLATHLHRALGGAATLVLCVAGMGSLGPLVRGAARPRGSGYAPASRAVLHVPRARAAIVLDGDNDDPGWLVPPGPARTGPFVTAGGAAATPYSEARLLWGEGHLYVLLYAADEDVRSRRDAFQMTFSRADAVGATYAIGVSADGAVRNEARDVRGNVDPSWRSGTHVSREIDGTLDDPSDTDEEWSLEIAVPLASLGLKGESGERLGFAVARCDAPEPGARGCGLWRGGGRERGQLVLE